MNINFLLLVNPSRPDTGQREKLISIFIFSLLCGTSKGFMKASKAFIKPFETPQRSVKIKISVNFHFNTTFWNAQGEKGLEEFIFRDNRKSTTHVLDDLTIPT